MNYLPIRISISSKREQAFDDWLPLLSEGLEQACEIRPKPMAVYDRPSTNRLTSQLKAPHPRSVIDAIARHDQIRVQVNGRTAANDLGLTDAVPAKFVVHAALSQKLLAGM